jgi:hypothetical protein
MIVRPSAPSSSRVRSRRRRYSRSVVVRRIVGASTFAEVFSQALKNQTIDMQIRDMFALDPLVVTCHYQLFESKTQRPREDLFIGVFLVKDGKIQEWNDYAIIPPCQRAAPVGADIRKFHQLTTANVHANSLLHIRK